MTDNDSTYQPLNDTAAAVTKYIGAYNENAGSSAYLDEDTWQSVKAAQNAIQRVVDTADGAATKMAITASDDTLYPVGRDRIVAETKAQAQEDIRQFLDSADTHLAVAEASAYLAARPALKSSESSAARQDALMLLDGMADRGVSLRNAVERLAGREDAVGALIADGTWLRDYAAARGMEPRVVDAVDTVLRQKVMESAANSTDSARRGAARTWLALRSLRQAHVSARAHSSLRLR